MNFTQGPWNVMPSKRSSLIHIETDANNPAGAGIPICSVPGNNLGNASLIAAAPELLDACRIALTALDKLMGDSDLPNDDSEEMKACQALSAVMAKATGVTV